MKKLLSLILSAVLALALVPFAAYAQSDLNLNAQNGRLLISEAGTYTLTGSMRGTVWVDPGRGDVTLILDNITIDGGESAGIAAVSGDSLTIILANSTVNSVRDGGSVWTLTGDSFITAFEGDLASVTANGYHLYVSGDAVL